MSGLLQRLQKSHLAEFAQRWAALRAGDGAILIAWQLLFSLFPLLLGLLSLLGLVLKDPERLASIASTIASLFPSQASELVGFITETRQLSGIFGVISVIGLLWSGSALFGAMGSVFNRLYSAPDRGMIQQRVVAFAMIFVYAVLLTVAVAASSVTSALVGISERILPFEVPNFAFVLGWLVSFSSAFLLFLILYRVVANVSLSVRDVWPGALLSTTLFMILTQSFPIYLRFLGGGFAAYKTLGVFLLLMTWFYFLGMMLVAGALLNAILSGHSQRPATEAGMSATELAQSHRRQGGRAQQGKDGEGPLKVVVWAGLVAAVSSLVLITARGIAAQLWRMIVREDPPG
jgi:membrane protein